MRDATVTESLLHHEPQLFGQIEKVEMLDLCGRHLHLLERLKSR